MSTVFDIPDQATYRTGTTQLVSALCWTNYVMATLSVTSKLSRCNVCNRGAAIYPIHF